VFSFLFSLFFSNAESATPSQQEDQTVQSERSQGDVGSVAMNRVEVNSSPRLICLSRLEQNLSRLELLPDLGPAIISSCTS
jgi:hypothetical protein